MQLARPGEGKKKTGHAETSCMHACMHEGDTTRGVQVFVLYIPKYLLTLLRAPVSGEHARRQPAEGGAHIHIFKFKFKAFGTRS